MSIADENKLRDLVELSGSHDEEPVDCQLETVLKVGAHFPMASESVTFPANGKEIWESDLLI